MTTCETIEKFPVVMLYDHFSSVSAALNTFSHLTHELETEFEPELRVWRMDDAASPEFIAEANADIVAAEVIILTVRGNQPWPKAFLHWKDGPYTEGSSGIASPRGIVTLIEADEDGVPVEVGSWNNVLSSAATQQIHPEVFVYEAMAEPGGVLSSTTQEFPGSADEGLAEVH